MASIGSLITTMAGAALLASAAQAQDKAFCESMIDRFRYEFGCCSSNPGPACTGLRRAAEQAGCSLQAWCEPCALIGYLAPPAGCGCAPNLSDPNMAPGATPFACLLPDNHQPMCCVEGDSIIACQTIYGGARFDAACYAPAPAAGLLGIRPRPFTRIDFIKVRP